jgi:hypothetical protein
LLFAVLWFGCMIYDCGRFVDLHLSHSLETLLAGISLQNPVFLASNFVHKRTSFSGDQYGLCGGNSQTPIAAPNSGAPQRVDF